MEAVPDVSHAQAPPVCDQIHLGSIRKLVRRHELGCDNLLCFMRGEIDSPRALEVQLARKNLDWPSSLMSQLKGGVLSSRKDLFERRPSRYPQRMSIVIIRCIGVRVRHPFAQVRADGIRMA
jgi:hypothetical protein